MFRWRLVLSCAVVGWVLGGCADTPAIDPTCLSALSLQESGSLPLGETYYLPASSAAAECPVRLEWQLVERPAGSAAEVRAGGPHPRFTPDVAGRYRFRIEGWADELTLVSVLRSPAERFRNHYLTPHFAAARVAEDEVWTGNGPSYTVSQLARREGAWSVVRTIPVGAWPGAIVGRADLDVVLVAQRGGDTVGFVSRARGVLEDAVSVGDEPTGLLLSPDAKTAYVSLATERAVAVLDLETRSVRGRIAVGFDPRALASSPDGRMLYVASHRSGNATSGPEGTRPPEDDLDVFFVDTARGEVVRTVSGVSADLRALALAPEGGELFVASTDGDPLPPQTGGNSFVHGLQVISTDPTSSAFGTVLRRVDLSKASGVPFVNPSGVLVRGDRVWVAAESSGEVAILERATLAEVARVAVGRGPRHLVDLGEQVLVHCHSSLEAWILDGPSGRVLQTVPLAEDPRPGPVALGEHVFTRPGLGFAANHACSSCHVETQNDGMVWRFGPNLWHNVRPLSLLSATTPLEWGAYVSSAHNFGFQGPPSIVNRPVTTEEALGLGAFLASLIGPPRATGLTRLDGSFTDEALRGKALFEGAAQCASCHAPPLYTNRKMVASGKSGEPADVPSLLGAYRHGVYFVNGRGRSLAQAVDVAVRYVGVELDEREKASIVRFLGELTPKGSAPLGVWPDLDSREAVLPTVRPWIEFADPPAADLREEVVRLAEFVILEGEGGAVDIDVAASGGRIIATPKLPLEPGRHRLRVLPGLRFQGGGVLEHERSTEFEVATPSAATLFERARLTVLVPSRGGGGTATTSVAIDLVQGPASLDDRTVRLSLGAGLEQTTWVRTTSTSFQLGPFALPVGRAVADAAEVRGTFEVEAGRIARAAGTLRIGGPGLLLPGVRWILEAEVPPSP